ncbi:hypothetical protein ACT3R7_11795 [Halomonas sp. AOP43-A1-21]
MIPLTEALAWNKQNPDQSVSAFACRYPGQYGEAAAALREVRRVERQQAEGEK